MRFRFLPQSLDFAFLLSNRFAARLLLQLQRFELGLSLLRQLIVVLNLLQQSFNLYCVLLTLILLLVYLLLEAFDLFQSLFLLLVHLLLHRFALLQVRLLILLAFLQCLLQQNNILLLLPQQLAFLLELKLTRGELNKELIETKKRLLVIVFL